MHQMAPPCEFIVLYFPIRTMRFVCSGSATLIQEWSMSHSMSSLPPPELKSRRSEQDGVSSGPSSSGYRITSASESTFEGYNPVSV